MFNKVVVGGTFDMLHKGHKRLLETAFGVGKSVIIGLTSDGFANRFRAVDGRPYENRKEDLLKFLGEKNFRNYHIVEISDSYGVATIDPESDCIVVSEETLLRAEEINAIRFKKGLEKLVIIVVPIMNAADGKAISVERIQRGEIDWEGGVLK